MSNELPVDGDWEAVNGLVRARMKQLNMSVAGLSRESGVSDTTIRYLREPGKRHKSTLVALSAVLGYAPDYLVKVLLGTADPETQPGTGPDPVTAQMLAVLQSIDGRLESIAGSLKDGPGRRPE